MGEGEHCCSPLGGFSSTLYMTSYTAASSDSVLPLMSTLDYFWDRAIFLFIKRLEYLAGHDGA